ncbi:TetR family transcriptional regulator [Microlunatus soli]|uniref:DNA-binding transcriptional regulator, AcrR family n=1 Tax=Microlunatus soli TaxID=630515 RepID=A0A1H1SYY4_9ACTN|nr:TetR family transcriptional regulator [Microlunatus soli]SDS53215.1 DNA-binding transcriptional regulator, AcrR family [Microlunatus soli]
MARWEPGAGERLQQAALDLFAEQGYEQTTVNQIAHRAGLTTRTFFRYFADKREVLFAGEEALPPMATQAITEPPAALSPLQVIEQALRSFSGTIFQGRSISYVRKRRAVIAADPSLRERELRKLADLRDAIGEGFRLRGLDDVAALLAAETALTVFTVSVRRWLGEGDSAAREPGEVDPTELEAFAKDTLEQLRALQ